MNDTLMRTLAAGLDLLQSLSRDGTRPEEAKQRLHLLQADSLGVSLDLLWEEEAYDQFVHYDMLFHLAPAGTVSLSFCPDRAVPWPLRGVHRCNEADLLRVNHTVMRIDQAIGCIDILWNEDRILNRLIDVCLMQEELEQNSIELSDTELQEAMNAFRRARRLYKAEDTRRWMERQGMTHDQLERLVGDEAIVGKLRDRITADKVEEYFAQHRGDFDSACMARLDFPDEASAEHAFSQLQSGQADFYEVAQCQAVAAATHSGEATAHLFAVVHRGLPSAEWKTALFAALPGQIIGPVRDGDSYALVRVLSFTPARLDTLTHRAIQKILFAEWLDERRQAATIEWFWGHARQPSYLEHANSGDMALPTFTTLSKIK